MKDKKEPSLKIKYEKPFLRTIELAADEVLSIGCKMANAGPGSGEDYDCGISSFCSEVGS